MLRHRNYWFRVSILAAAALCLVSALLPRTAHAQLLTVGFEGKVDKSTLDMINRLPESSLLELEAFVAQVDPQIKRNISDFSLLVQAEIIHIVDHTKCDLKAALRHAFDPVKERDALKSTMTAWNKLQAQIGPTSSPRALADAYDVFIGTASTKLCDASPAPVLMRPISEKLSEANWRANVWHHLVKLCTRSDECYERLHAETDQVISSADPQDRMNLRDIYYGIHSPSQRFAGRRYDAEVYEKTLRSLLLIQDEIQEAKELREKQERGWETHVFDNDTLKEIPDWVNHECAPDDASGITGEIPIATRTDGYHSHITVKCRPDRNPQYQWELVTGPLVRAREKNDPIPAYIGTMNTGFNSTLIVFLKRVPRPVADNGLK